MKKIKKLLSEHSAEILPDKHIKDNIKRQLGYEEKEVSLSYAHGGEKTVKENRNKHCALRVGFCSPFGSLYSSPRFFA